MDTFDKASFDALLEALPEFDAELMDSLLQDGRGDGPRNSSFPGFTAEEQKHIIETFQAYSQHQAGAGQHQASPAPSPTNQSLADIYRNTSNHQNNVGPSSSNAFPMMAQPASYQTAPPLPPPGHSCPVSPSFQRLQGASSSSRHSSGQLPDRIGSDRISPDSPRHYSGQQIKRRPPSDDGDLNSGRYSPSMLSPAGSFSAGRRPNHVLGSSPPSTAAGIVSPQASLDPPSYPRTSLAELGALAIEADFGGEDDDDEKRREKNRLAQRKFREKQKTLVVQLQSQLDAKEAQLQTAISLIRDLTAKLTQYQARYGPLTPSRPAPQGPPM